MQEIDYLIVGQGIAGTLLAYFLIKNKQRVLVIDEHHSTAASAVAAGIINPITGRRIVKTWMIDEILPFAKSTYQEIETLLNINIWQERSLLWGLSNIKEENDWFCRSSAAEIKPYILDTDASTWQKAIKNINNFGEVKAAQVDLLLLIRSFKNYLLSQNKYSDEKFEYDALKCHNNKIVYKQIVAKKLIFCEGEKGRFNPFFSMIPFAVAKGELLHIHFPKGENRYKILKNGITIAPLFVAKNEEMKYWVGSNYEWNPKDANCSEDVKSLIIKELSNFIDTEYKIIGHSAAIRPTLNDRRPVLGIHPKYSSLAIFNGLGTKGTSLAPYFAKMMAVHLVNKTILQKEVDIQRFL